MKSSALLLRHYIVTEREWQIALRIKHSQNTESNSPYFFMIAVVGFFAVSEAVPAAKTKSLACLWPGFTLYRYSGMPTGKTRWPQP